MGNYNCQECISKEVNVINELLLDNNSYNSINQDNTKVFRIKDLKSNSNEIEQGIDEPYISNQQNQNYEKNINDNSNINQQQNIYRNIKNINGNNSEENEQNNYKQEESYPMEQLNSQKEEQKKMIELQQKKIYEQQKIIDQYKQKQMLKIYQNEPENKQKIKMHNFDQPENDFQKEDENQILLQNNHNDYVGIEQIEDNEIDEQNKAIIGQEQHINTNQIDVQNEPNQDNEENYNQKENEENEQEQEQEEDYEESELKQIQVDENDGKKENSQEQDEEEEDNHEIKGDENQENGEELNHENDEEQNKKNEEELYQEEEDRNINQEENQEEENTNDMQEQEQSEDNNNQNIIQVEESEGVKIDDESRRIDSIEQKFIPQIYSQKFKIETYEPSEQKVENDIENDNEINYEEDIEDNEKKIKLIEKMNIKEAGPRDSKRQNNKDPVIRKQSKEKNINDFNYINNTKNIYNMNILDNNYIYEQMNNTGSEPQDSDNCKSNSNIKKINNLKNNNSYGSSSKKVGPMDSKRKLSQPNKPKIINDNNRYYYNNNYQVYAHTNEKRQTPLNANEIRALNNNKYNKNNMNYPIDNYNNNNPKPNVVLNQPNYIKKENEEISNQNQYRFVIKEVIPSDYSGREQNQIQYYQQRQQLNQNNNYQINKNNQVQKLSPFNEMNTAALNHNLQRLENFEDDSRQMTSENPTGRNAVTFGPYLNEVEEINNAYSSGTIINHKDNQEKSDYNYDFNQLSSQKEYDITLSDKENTLIYSDEKGNMNYLEKRYVAYQNKKNRYKDDI
jgi:hypothetical protein